MALLSNRTGASDTDDETPRRTATVTADRPQVDNRRPLSERTAAATRIATATPATAVPAGPRARVSVVATMALMFGLTAALSVLTGVLAGAGIAIGMVAAFLGVAGIASTGRRHVAGKGNALLGIALGLAAVVIGTLSLTHSLPWLNPTANEVARVHDWLALHLPWLVPAK
jgi:hypothetical protein